MIQGSLVAIVTPMHADGGVDEQAFRRLIDWHVAQGTDAIVAVGTTGESATLDEDEHCAAIAVAVDQAGGRIPVIAGTGANSTSEAIALTRCAKAAGADACLLVTPYYNKPTQEGLFLHHKAVAEAVDIPQILYNVPGRTAVDMLPETVARIAQVDNVVGVKEATGQLDRITRLRELTPPGFAVYSGDDATAREAILLGADGDISVTANIAPAAMHAMCAAALAGDSARAEQLDAPLAGLHRDLFLEANPIPVKWALAEMGLIERGIRLPLTWFSESFHGQLRAAMQQAGIL
ncbi:MAG: 4-hydroxy-tetrahydrodipicolinate synthase [Gammaproteobacteria bacterium]|nr:4-hydroxy-tetrahydrodipicolinate synthase [Gammaproteobacteria bacterium]MCP5312768.1 4-hydroxy-tetrahydrodipicolinate synthase [Chromatiaceae bacterium]